MNEYTSAADPGPSLTFEKLEEILNLIEPIPYMGYTMQASEYYKLSSYCQNVTEINKLGELGIRGPYDEFGCVEVVLVDNQDEPSRQWDDREKMWAFIKEMREKDDSEKEATQHLGQTAVEIPEKDHGM